MSEIHVGLCVYDLQCETQLVVGDGNFISAVHVSELLSDNVQH